MSGDFENVAAQADRFGNWDARLKLEIPFFAALLQRHGANKVCDAGCGAGRHTVALTQMGFTMTGVDPNEEYVQQARGRAETNQVAVSFHQGSFDDVSLLTEQPFDAITVFGNALSLVESPERLRANLKSFSACLRAPGLLLAQVPNYHLFDDPEKRWKVLSRETHPQPRMVLKHFSPWDESYFAVEFLTVSFDGAQWDHVIRRTRVLALTEEKLRGMLSPEFKVIEAFGHADGRPFDSQTSPDFIVLAAKSS